MSAIEVEVIESALQSVSEWQEFQSEQTRDGGRLRVSGWQCLEREFVDYRFDHCDFVAVDMNGTRFVRSQFHDCLFSGCVFNDVTFERVAIEDVRFSTVKGRGVVLRDVNMRDVETRECELESIDTQSCQISNLSSFESHVDGCLVDDVRVKVARVKGGTVHDASMRGLHGVSLELSETAIEEATLSDGTLHGCVFDDVGLSGFKASGVNVTETKLNHPHLESLSIENCRFSDGQISRAELDRLCISKLGLHGTALLSCEWPEQDYHVGVLGGYHPAEHLLKQPVEDISGISPSHRETIRRAQRVDAMFNPAPGLLKSLALRLWGASSAYGRSVGRLTLTCLVLVMLASIVFLLGNVGELSLCQLPLELLKSFESIFMSFLGVDVNISGLSSWQEATLIVTRLSGVVLFGIWIGVAATRFGEM